MKPAFELADVLREYGEGFVAEHAPLKYHLKVLNVIQKCRTAEMGYHIDRCDNCQYESRSYNSCRNRHCPKCQGSEREKWIAARMDDILDCTYFHVVFTLPNEINTWCLKYPRELYNILFQCSWDTLSSFGQNPKHLGAQMGAISVLHTWGQNLSLHPHVHMIVPGGGFDKQNNWKNSPSNGDYLFNCKAMAKTFRGKFMERLLAFLVQEKKPMETRLRRLLYDKNWVVYAKQPFKNAEGVVEYLGRYSHKIAISNHRIKSIENGKVSFTYRDYAHGNVTKTMTLDATEFIRRFCLHILPPGFVKIRHFGFLANRAKKKLKTHQMVTGTLPQLTQKIVTSEGSSAFKPLTCPCCKTGRMITILVFGANAPPSAFSTHLNIKQANEK
ncbi:MAG TPA: IS91 family transposase [Rhodocyclaceae bacterium]|nr:IS91 family transposase [Rhodocyclaceae bacterium]